MTQTFSVPLHQLLKMVLSECIIPLCESINHIRLSQLPDCLFPDTTVMIEIKRGCVLCEVRAEDEEGVDLRAYKGCSVKEFP